MGFFKTLAYATGAMALAPVTGAGSIVLAVKAVNSAKSSRSDYQRGLDEGAKAGERAAQQKYEQKIAALTERLQAYQDFDKKLVAMYAIGLAVANADGVICEEERAELDQFVAGCMAGHLPPALGERIAKLSANPPTLPQALQYAKRAKLPKFDIDDIVDVIVNADGVVNTHEEAFIARWKAMAADYEASLA